MKSTTTYRCPDCRDEGLILVDDGDAENGPSLDPFAPCSCAAGMNKGYEIAMRDAFRMSESALVELGKTAKMCAGWERTGSREEAYYLMMVRDLRDMYRLRFGSTSPSLRAAAIDMEMKAKFAEHERAQEARAFLNDPY